MATTTDIPMKIKTPPPAHFPLSQLPTVTRAAELVTNYVYSLFEDPVEQGVASTLSSSSSQHLIPDVGSRWKALDQLDAQLRVMNLVTEILDHSLQKTKSVYAALRKKRKEIEVHSKSRPSSLTRPTTLTSGKQSTYLPAEIFSHICSFLDDGTLQFLSRSEVFNPWGKNLLETLDMPVCDLETGVPRFETDVTSQKYRKLVIQIHTFRPDLLAKMLEYRDRWKSLTVINRRIPAADLWKLIGECAPVVSNLREFRVVGGRTDDVPPENLDGRPWNEVWGHNQNPEGEGTEAKPPPHKLSSLGIPILFLPTFRTFTPNLSHLSVQLPTVFSETGLAANSTSNFRNLFKGTDFTSLRSFDMTFPGVGYKPVLGFLQFSPSLPKLRFPALHSMLIGFQNLSAQIPEAIFQNVECENLKSLVLMDCFHVAAFHNEKEQLNLLSEFLITISATCPQLSQLMLYEGSKTREISPTVATIRAGILKTLRTLEGGTIVLPRLDHLSIPFNDNISDINGTGVSPFEYIKEFLLFRKNNAPVPIRTLEVSSCFRSTFDAAYKEEMERLGLYVHNLVITTANSMTVYRGVSGAVI